MSVRYLARKMITLAITLYVTVSFNFLLFHVLPGNPVQLLARSGHFDAAARTQLIKLFGLNHSLLVQYFTYLNDMAHGHLGFSYIYREPVTTVLGSAVGNTVLLVGTATVITVIVGVWFGVVAAARANSLTDASITVTSLSLWSMPDFFTGMILIFIFGVWSHVFPVSGIESPGLTTGTFGHVFDIGRHLILPALTLTLVNAAEFSLITRNTLVDVLVEDYIVTARAKGLRRHVIIWRHAVRNALLPVVTATALYVGMILGGAIQVETVFSWPGLGLLTYNAVEQRDYPVLEGSFLLFAIAVIATNFFADLLYQALDARVRET
ncbi:MAG TPA: ABC transporter permease [Acidimicrobiales bacterium]|nr:ABC transporter permease [Acidimicrobiales bacterium]